MTDNDRLPGLRQVREHIAQCCQQAGRDPAEIRLIAVTKNQPPTVLTFLAAAGISDYGENRCDHLAEMALAQMTEFAEPDTRAQFHFIGRVQRRQFRQILAHSRIIHSLANPEHIPSLDSACQQLALTAQVFCQVNMGLESHKAGISPAQLPAMLDQLAACAPRIEVLGLMTMAPDLNGGQADEAAVRRCFAELRALAHRHGLKRLSMGMSGDYHLAIAEGATDLRIGSALFAGFNADD